MFNNFQSTPCVTTKALRKTHQKKQLDNGTLRKQNENSSRGQEINSRMAKVILTQALILRYRPVNSSPPTLVSHSAKVTPN